MAKKNLAEAAAAILSGNMATLKPMSKDSEAFGQAGTTPVVDTPGQEGSPQTIQPAIATADEAGVTKAIDAAPAATPPGAKPAAAEPMKKGPSQVNEEDDEDEKKDEDEKDEDEDEDEDDKKAMKEDLDALFYGEDLSEDFMNKAATIFEAAVNSRVGSIEEKLQEQYADLLEEVVEQLKEEMTSKVDDYLNYVVEEWVKENELAIESGLRSELTEDFIAGLRNLFTEHYIDIPEEKVDVVEEMTAKVVELEEKLNEQISESVEMRKELIEYAKREMFVEICEGLTSTQIEKMKSLSEGVDFSNVEDYKESLLTLRENYFPTKSTVNSSNSRLDEETDIVEEAEMQGQDLAKKNKLADPIMEAYVKSISRTVIK